MSSKKPIQQIQQLQHQLQQGDLEAAELLSRKLHRKHPRMLEVAFLRGEILGRLGRHGEAEKAFQGIAHLPDAPPGLFRNIALAQQQQGKLEQALDSYRTAAERAPEDPVIIGALCSLMIEMERYTEAQSWLRRWTEISPIQSTPWMGLGIVCQGRHQWKEAEQAYQEAINLGEKGEQVQMNLSAVYDALNDVPAMLEAARAALDAAPGSPIARCNLANYYLKAGQVEQALETWRPLAQEPGDPHGAGSSSLYASHYLNDITPQQLYQAHIEWASRLPSIEVKNSTDEDEISSTRPIRVAYLSEGFHEHPIGFFTLPLIRYHDRQRFHVTLIADLAVADSVSQTFRSLCDEWIDITGLNDTEAAERIARANIDILVELDGHTGHRIRLMANRLAQIQVSYLGYPNTTGLDSVDYRITDAVVDPPEHSDPFYTEQLMRLQRPFFSYAPPGIKIEPGPSPCERNGHFTFGSFNKPAKLNDGVISRWSRILLAVPNSKLLLQMATLSSTGGQQAMCERFADHGISGDRLILHGWGSLNEYLALHNEVDLILDPTPWNGHTNTCHALWMGVPTLTLDGDRFYGRFGRLIMQAVGCDDFVCADEAAFIEKARKLETEQERCRSLRPELRRTLLDSPLCDDEGLTRAMEKVFLMMVKHNNRRH